MLGMDITPRPLAARVGSSSNSDLASDERRQTLVILVVLVVSVVLRYSSVSSGHPSHLPNSVDGSLFALVHIQDAPTFAPGDADGGA